MFSRCGAVPVFCTILVFFTSCSFNYMEGLESEKKYPEMVMNGVSASRYENAKVSLMVTAKTLEIYDTDRVWAGENVSFRQYSGDESGTVDVEANAGLFLVDDAAGVYSLGNNTRFRLVRDDMEFSAPDLQWTRKTHRLCGPRTGEVVISSKDGTSITGIGFVADTMSRSYSFSRTVSGQMATGKDEPGTSDAAAAGAGNKNDKGASGSTGD